MGGGGSYWQSLFQIPSSANSLQILFVVVVVALKGGWAK